MIAALPGPLAESSDSSLTATPLSQPQYMKIPGSTPSISARSRS